MNTDQPVFLTADWRRLVMLNYRVDPDWLTPYLPAHTEPELWNGTCYASVVGFRFLDTRLKGIPIPLHRNFTEINLRFYVRRHDPVLGWKRGVVFIREVVPKPAITLLANLLYRERYRTRPTRYHWQEAADELHVEYTWRQQRRWQTIGIKADPTPIALKEGSEAEFISQQNWGYTRAGPGKTFEYEVQHPRWQMYPVRSWYCDIDFGAVYGKAFAPLTQAEPVSVFLAEGSEARIFHKTVLI